MFKLKLILCLIFLGFGLSGHVFAGGKKSTPSQKLRIDTAKIAAARAFNAHEIDKFKKDKDFNYSGNGIGDEPSLWDRFWSWLWDKVGRAIGSVPHGGTILMYTLLLGAIIFLIYVILKAVGIDMVKLWKGDSQKLGVPYSETLENIHEINFDEEIERAISQHNFRLAVRLLYLRCLKQLSDKRIIDWQIDKTNHAYIDELNDTEQKHSFSLLTRQFEYVWYGDFPIDQQGFTRIFNFFQDFRKRLS